MQRTVIGLAAVALVGMTSAAVPAGAAGSWTACDTDTMVKTAKYAGAVKLTIRHQAKGCMKYRPASGRQPACSVLTSLDTDVSIIVQRSGSKEVRRYTVDASRLPDTTKTSCFALEDNTGIAQTSKRYSGQYKIDLTLKKDPHATPGATVSINSIGLTSSADKESIVTIKPTGSWTFTKANNNEKAKPNDGNSGGNPGGNSGGSSGGNSGGGGGGVINLPAAPALPSVNGGGGVSSASP